MTPPFPCSIMAGVTERMASMVPVALMLITRSQALSVRSGKLGAPTDAGVGEERVDLSESVEGGQRGCFDLFFRRDVTGHPQRL